MVRTADVREAMRLVARGHERVIVEENGQAVAALIPLEDLAVLRELEDRIDAEEAEKALAESDERIHYEKVRRDLARTELASPA